jgi:hypothetical protein
MTTDNRLLSRVALRVRQGVCGLHGHDALLHFDKGRMSLLCSSCGHESPGWDLTGSRASHEVTRVADAQVHVSYAAQRRAA